MDWLEILKLAGEILLPVLLALLQKNTKITENNLTETQALKAELIDRADSQKKWETRISDDLRRSTEITLQNSRTIEALLLKQNDFNEG